MLLQVAHGTSGRTVSVPAGWTLVASVGSPHFQEIYAKIAGASEPSTVSVTISGAAVNMFVGIVTFFSTVPITLTVDATANQVNASSTNRVWAGVTTTAANGQLACFGNFSAASNSTPDGAMTERWDTGTAIRSYLMTQALGAAGATGTRTATAVGALASNTVTVSVVENAVWSLVATGVDTGAPTVGAPALTQAHSLVAVGIATGAPTVGEPSSGQVHTLVAAGLTTGAPTVGAPLLASSINLPDNLDLHMFVLNKRIIFQARVDMALAVYPSDYIDYDTVTLGVDADVRPGMLLLLGSTAGADDLGRTRIAKYSDPVADRIFTGRYSIGTRDGELTVTNNAYITVVEDYRVWAKTPRIDEDTGDIFKDSDLPVEWRTTNPPPVANAGADVAATVNAATDVITVTFDAFRSFAVADGATITGYLWEIDDGTLTVGALTSQSITATFVGGWRYVHLTVTDSNAHTHTAHVLVFAWQPNFTGAGFDTIAFGIESHRASQEGQQLSVRVYDDLPADVYLDGAHVLIWEREPSTPADRTHMTFSGWMHTEPASIQATREGLLRNTTLQLLDVAGKLDTLPGFPQVLNADSSRDVAEFPTITWSFMVNPTLDKYLHYILHWHSTALEVADWTDSGEGDNYPFTTLTSDGMSLWDQAKQRARAFIPDRILTCGYTGQMRVKADPPLQEDIDRVGTIQATLTEDDWSDVRFTAQRPPRAHWLRAGAILAGETVPIGTVFSIAPGVAPGQGLMEQTQNEQLAISQYDLNAATGHRYARMNAPTSEFVFELVGGPFAWRNIEPALLQWVEATMSAKTAAHRGLTFTAARGLPKEMNFRYPVVNGITLRDVSMTWEKETSGEPGVTKLKTTIPPVGEQPTPPPAPPAAPDYGLREGQELVAAINLDGYVYRTSDFQTPSGSGGPTWDRVNTSIAEVLYSFVVDPFSPGYLDGAGAINGWIATETDIYRVEDLFGSVVTTSVHTFATATSAGSYHWRSIQASFGTYFADGLNPWLLCISYYGSTGGHTGAWAMRSLDGGVTWETETQVSAFYDSGSLTRFNPIGVYASPKTPGLAYTAAFTVTASPALALGYVSTDWGETWTQMDAAPVEDPDEPLPVWGIVRDGTWTQVAVGGQGSGDVGATQSGGAVGAESDVAYLVLAPPANAVRVLATADWTAAVTRIGGVAGSAATSLDLGNPSNATHTDNEAFDPPGPNEATSGSFTVEWTKSDAADWNINKTSVASSPPTSAAGARFWLSCTANSTGGSTTVTSTVSVTVTITEIELDDSSIYVPPVVLGGAIQPVHAQAGQIHGPWIDNADEALLLYGSVDKSGNREFRLKQAVGVTVSDISPSEGGILFGTNKYGFSIRAMDENRQHLLLAGTGNDTSALPSADVHGVFYSADFGATWQTVVTPIADDAAFAGRPAFEAAFSSDNPAAYFIWGPPAYMAYTDSGAVGLDDRSGNLASFSPDASIGIAGGPIP